MRAPSLATSSRRARTSPLPPALTPLAAPLWISGGAPLRGPPRRLSAELPITFADTSHALEELKYEPQVSTEKGVHHFIEWYRWYQEVGVKTDFPTKDAYLPKRK